MVFARNSILATLASLANSCDLSVEYDADCSTFCDDNPGRCEAICDENPEMKGCPWNGGGLTTAPPVVCEPENCQAECAGDDYRSAVKCQACKACLRPPKFCALNPDTKGCDEWCCNEGCSEQCYRKHIGVIISERQCMWHVKDQFHEVFAPLIMEANIDATCPLGKYYDQHFESCELCSRLHVPCNDSYIACGGCCGSPLHTQYNSLRNLSVNTHHSCDEIKHYFLNRNSIDVQCVPEPPTPEPIGQVNITRVDPDNNDYLDYGIIKDKCSTNVEQVVCDQVPFKMKFSCDDCNSKGSPLLLDKCCTKCVEWIDSLANNSGIPGYVKPYAWCSGCNVTHIESLIEGMPDFEWNVDGVPAHTKYAEYTEAKADQGILDHIEENVCKLLTPSCGKDEPETTTTQNPGFMPVTEKPIQVKPVCMPWDECHDARRLQSGIVPAEGQTLSEGTCEAAEYMKQNYKSVPGTDGRTSQADESKEHNSLDAQPTNPSPTPAPTPAGSQDPVTEDASATVRAAAVSCALAAASLAVYV